jgi:hypothetical protein
VFVVSQVDGEGYVLPDAIVEAVKNMYTEDSLKILAEEVVPDCSTEANSYARSG